MSAQQAFRGPNMTMIVGLIPLGLWSCGFLLLMIVWQFHEVGFEVYFLGPSFLFAYLVAFVISGGAFLWADRRGLANEAGLPVFTRKLMRMVLVALIAPMVLLSIVSIIWGSK